MEKSMYSLILMDDVVKAADKLAHERGLSRSSLINRVLAEHLCILTPELCISQIFGEILTSLQQEACLLPSPPSASILTVRGLLPYRYNPAIYYRFEITDAAPGRCTGVFSATSRSQSITLLTKLTIFFELWSQIEISCVLEKFPSARVSHQIGGGQLRRSLHLYAESAADMRMIGKAASGYLALMRDAIDLYFGAELGVDMQTFSQMAERYRAYLKQTSLII